MGHGLLFLFCFLFKTGSSYYLAVLELVIWPNLALNSQISTWVGGLMACTSMLGYENFFLPLPSVLSTGVSALFPLRPAMVVQVSNSSSWEAEATRSGVQDCFWLHRKCEVSLNYKRPCLKKTVTMMPPPLEAGWGFMAALVNRMLKFNLQSQVRTNRQYWLVHLKWLSDALQSRHWAIRSKCRIKMPADDSGLHHDLSASSWEAMNSV